MHEVHALTRFGDPFTTARTRWMFGFQRRLVRRCEWLSFMPKIGFLSHTSQTEDIVRGTSDRASVEHEKASPPVLWRSIPTLTCLSAADLRQAVLRFRDALR